MADNVKFIFKSLLKVPIIIFVTYAVFNLIFFGATYFKVLGLSYVAMQVVVENNYIPDAELATLEAYIDTLEDAAMLSNGTITVQPEGEATANNKRVQYGTPVTVTVGMDFELLIPLMPHEQVDNGVVASG